MSQASPLGVYPLGYEKTPPNSSKSLHRLGPWLGVIVMTRGALPDECRSAFDQTLLSLTVSVERPWWIALGSCAQEKMSGPSCSLHGRVQMGGLAKRIFAPHGAPEWDA
jgi:hypothetical protein